MTDYDDLKRGTAREWLWAKIVFVSGFVIAIAVFGYLSWQRHQETVAAHQEAAAQQQAQQPAPHVETAAEANAKAGMMVCAMELVNAKNMGLIPAFGQLSDPEPRNTAKRGRLACMAATQVSKYVIEADLVCRTLVNPQCVRVHKIASDDGTVLYQAKD